MRCEDVRTQLLDVADGAELSPELAGHLESCRTCREHLEMLCRHRQLLAHVSAPSAPVGLRMRIKKEIDYRQGLRIRKLWWAAAAAMVLIAGTLTYLVLPGEVALTPLVLPGEVSVTSVDDVTPVDGMLLAEAPVNGEAVDYLVTRHAVLQNAFILNAALVNKTEQNEYLTVAEGYP